MKQVLEIGRLLDICEITYTLPQLLKLEKLIELTLEDVVTTNEELDEDFEDDIAVKEEEFEEALAPKVELDEFDSSYEEPQPVKKRKRKYVKKESADPDDPEGGKEKKVVKIPRVRRKRPEPNKKWSGATLCQQCGQSFETTTQLRKHVHNKHKSLIEVCGTCGHKFHSHRDLQRHIDGVHDGRRDFQCQWCGNKFSSKHTLKRHVARIHEKQNHTCHHCGKIFNLIGMLKTHLKKVHEQIYQPDDKANNTGVLPLPGALALPQPSSEPKFSLPQPSSEPKFSLPQPGALPQPTM